MGKYAPRDLAQVLSRLPEQPPNENVLVGYDHADDAGVFRLSNGVALVQTIDFFSPITDNPYIYGQIAAVNALNDVYAMGGKPVTALTIMCYPQKEDVETLKEILSGGQQMMIQEGVAVIGGHTIDDPEIKIGYAVTGVVNPAEVITNAGAQIGDRLLLTKPLGTGAISTAIKREKASQTAIDAVIACMTRTGRAASEAMQRAKANACTDITGFGLLGHAFEMAQASDVCLVIDSQSLPLLPDVLDLIRQGMLTRGDKNNRVYVGDTIEISRSVSGEMQSALYDPQTAGGLLISITPEKADDLARKIGANIIGTVEANDGYLLKVV